MAGWGRAGGRAPSDAAGSGVDVPPRRADARLDQDQALGRAGVRDRRVVSAATRHGWGLLIGEIDEQRVLRYRGQVEFGITADVRAAFEEQLAALARRTSPFTERLHEPDAVSVAPKVPAEIRYLERTSGGLLRHAAFRQLGGPWRHWV
jgi:ATP dependent DNA ligase C terminal region